MTERISSSEEMKNAIKKEWGADRVWSYSQISSFDQDKYGWFLQYIKQLPHDKEDANAYGIYGNVAHSIMQDYYEGKIKKEECLDVYKKQWDKLSLMNLNFNNTDADQNAKSKSRYQNNLYNFFANFNTVDSDVRQCERPIAIKVTDGTRTECFLGFIDFLSMKNENGHKKYSIIDYKTSTMYKGKDIEEHSRQLLLYGIGLKNNFGLDYEDITLAWNFLKYVNVEEMQKNGSVKIRSLERQELVEKLRVSIFKWMKECGYDEVQSNNVYMQCLSKNDLSDLPADVKEKFTVKDCIVNIPFNEEIKNYITGLILDKCAEIRNVMQEYDKTKDESLFYWQPTVKDEFYYYNLCSYSTNVHKPFKDYFENKKAKEDENTYVDIAKVTETTDNLNDFFAGLNK